MPRVGAIGLRALLGAAAGAGHDRLGEMHLGAARAQLLGHEPPARRRLERRLDRKTAEAAQEPAHMLPVRGRDPRPADLAGGRVDPLGRDLRPVLIEPNHDRPRSLHSARVLERRLRRVPSAHVGTDASNTVAHGRYLRSNGRPRGSHPRVP
jgi:hypothetical protein